MTYFETLLVGLDAGLPARLFRVVVGFALSPALLWIRGDHESDWALVPFLLSVLLLFRLVPIFVRRLLPTSEAARRTWAARRQLAKRYDSYQWQKLFWIGVGLGLHIAVSGNPSPARLMVASFCLLAGGCGIVRWRAVGQQHSMVLPAEQTRTTA